MIGRREVRHALGQRGIVGDEAVAEVLSTVEQLRDEVARLKERVDSQFTTIAAHAEIAQNHAELARNEGRSDLQRTRETLISLIEQVRSEMIGRDTASSSPGSSSVASCERFDRLEARLHELESTFSRCFSRQTELADTMAAFLDTVLAEQRGEPVSGLSLG